MPSIFSYTKSRSPFAIIAMVWLLLSCQTSNKSENEHVLAHRITDHANILTVAQVDSLTAALEALETEIGSQIGILILRELGGKKIEEVSLMYAEASRLGRAGYDDGVLITVAYADRQIRIEVGLGLEEIVKDEIATRILREDVAPHFRNGEFASGLLVAVNKISKIIRSNKGKIRHRQG